jgi:MFS family permease
MTISSGNMPTPPVPSEPTAAQVDEGLEPGPTGVVGGGGFIVLLALANLGTWFAFFTPLIYTLQIRVEQLAPHNAPAALAVVVAIGAIFGLIANPLAGRLSDRTTSRFGMRRPWLLGTFVVGIVGLVVMGFSPNIFVLGFGALIMGIGYTGNLAVLLALIPDHVPAKRRAFASGLLGVTQALAIIIGVGVAGGLATHSIVAAFIVPGIVGLVLMLIRVLTLKDRHLDKTDKPTLNARIFFASFWTNPRKFPNFGWAWLSRFLLFLSFSSVVTYQVFFLHSQMGLKLADASTFIQRGLGVQTGALIVASVLAGLISDRLKRRKIFVGISALVGAGGLVVFATATTFPQYFVGLAIIGFAQGTYYAVDLALVADVLPDRQHSAAKDLGVLSIATQLPTTLIPLYAPLILAIGIGNVVKGSTTNYTALFVVSAIFALGAAVTIIPVRGSR